MRDPQYTILREAERRIEREIDEIEKNPSVNSARAGSLAKSAFELGIETGKKMAEAKLKSEIEYQELKRGLRSHLAESVNR